MIHRLAIVLTLLGFGVITAGGAAERADLAIARLTVRPLCVGDGNTVEVVVTNHGGALADPGFDIVVTVQLPGHPPQRHSRTARAVAPGERHTTSFDGIAIAEPAEVLVRAEVDPEHRVDDPNRSDNTAAVLERATERCGGMRRSATRSGSR